MKPHSMCMTPRLTIACLTLFSALTCTGQYTMPPEEAEHEGTWLQWPHDYTYGAGADALEPSWVAMTAALATGERVHIVAYNEAERTHIETVLGSEGVDLDQVDFLVCPNDDFWVRDNGPIFVEDLNGDWVILDWGFNGWGGDAPYTLDDAVPGCVGTGIGMPVIDLGDMVLEGGAVELDGHGTLMATRSSVTAPDRNPDLTEAEIESYLSQYLGVDQFIWLDGQFGGTEDITDMHIDAFVKFVGGHTMVTMSDEDLEYWYVGATDRAIVADAADADGVPYSRVNLPLTQMPVVTSDGTSIGYRASYVNFYVANEVVLVPHYNDPMDTVAMDIIQDLHPARTVVGIPCQDMLQWGGMVHCVTQQQPAGAPFVTSVGCADWPETSADARYFDLLGREVFFPKAHQLLIRLGPDASRHLWFTPAD